MLSAILIGCSISGDKKTLAKKLSDSAISVTNNYQDTSKFYEAITLLEQAIQLDSTNFYYYKDKYFFEASLGRSTPALNTVRHLLEFKPDSAELHFHAGVLQLVNRDTTQAINSFAKASSLFRATLDTMDRKSPYYFYDWRLWATSMIMIDQGDIILQFLLENCTTPMDSSIFDPETLSKSKQELMQMISVQFRR